MRRVLFLSSLALLAEAQKVGDLQQEIHPKVSWKQCTSSTCDTVQGEITIDAEYRWIHVVDDWHSCFERQEWQTDYCNSTQSCTELCAVDGAYYPGYGIVTNGDSLSQQYETPIDFSKSQNSRVFLMEDGGDKYQTFSLLGNELAFDDRLPQCDSDGCDYNPYRLGVTDFYGIGGDVDTSKKFTVVTRFAEDKITKFFIQDGKRIDAPSPALPNFPDVNGLSKDYCRIKTVEFSEPDIFEALGGVARQNDILRRPMVMALSIQDDVRSLLLSF
ncbi:hypothetical protein Brms1b_012739 [Colletotrichum noveboracense]|nr:hypothetical protein CBS470a_012377 [Colletotrichum nupharicola]KAJ0300600.1 hypothetical protein Brms1b_012739 [Colletotrichum noveboracense]